MSLTGLFKAVCYDSLTSYGFKYKSRTFYRIHGDGMFQAISVWDRTHYEINAVNAPIWSLEDKIHICEKYFDIRLLSPEPGLKIMVSEGLKRGDLDMLDRKSFPYPWDYDRSDESKTLENFKVADEVFRNYLLPAFDRTVDFPSYLEWRAGYYFGGESDMGLEMITPFELCVKAYRDGSPEEACRLYDKIMEHRFERQKKLYIEGKSSEDNFQKAVGRLAVNDKKMKKLYDMLLAQEEKCDLNQIQKDAEKYATDCVNDLRKKHYCMFVSSAEKGDFSWVEGELERREQYGRKIIKYVLGEKALEPN